MTAIVAALTRTSYAQGLGRALVTLSWFGAALWCAIIAYPLAVSGTVGAPESAAVVLMCTAMIESSVQHIEAVRLWSSFATLSAQIAPGIADENSVSGLEDDTQDTSHAGRVCAPQGQEPALELVDAAARWPSMDKPVFEHLNATAHTGKWTGITGPSGSGKSTVLATLLGFLPLEAGEIRSYGKALGNDQLRGYAAWCPQAAHILSLLLKVIYSWRAIVLIARVKNNDKSSAACRFGGSGTAPCRKVCTPVLVLVAGSCREASGSVLRWLVPCSWNLWCFCWMSLPRIRF